MSPLDFLWRWADRFAFVRRAGTSDEATHLNHTLVCAGGAGLGAVTALAFHADPLNGARLVWFLCWLAYLARESRQHGRARWGWDGVMDLVTPFCWGGVGLSGGHVTLSVWFVASAVLALGYTVFRPSVP